jgi:hypothetical protein
MAISRRNLLTGIAFAPTFTAVCAHHARGQTVTIESTEPPPVSFLLEYEFPRLKST